MFSFPTRDGPTICFATDTAYFNYDAAGNLRRADNNWAWVRRAYTPSGLLASDTLYTRTYETSAPYPGGAGDRHGGALVASDFTTYHVYALRYSYDLDGRRRELHHPAPIAPCAGACLQRYGYHGVTGTLDTVVDPLGHVTRFAYDNAGRLVTNTSPGGAAIASSYDADSRLTRRLGLITSDTLSSDATNRVVTGSVSMPGAGDRAIELAYTGLGALNWSAGITGGSGFEDFATDALGNRTWLRDQGIGDYGDRTRYWSYDNGQLTQGVLGTGPCGNPGVSMSSCHPAWYHFEHNASYDGSGNNDATWGDDTQGSDAETALHLNDESRSYYGADEQLMVRNRHLGLGTGSYPGGVFEEYRYDALGRRVFVRSRRTSSCAQAPGYHYQCGSYVERTVWDGAQVLYEIRGGGRDSLDVGFLEDDGGGLPATEPHMFGRAVYTHALGIDQPVGILRLDAGAWTFLAPHANWRGSSTYGTLADGSVCPGAAGCPPVPWPGNETTADGGSTSTAPTAYTAWYGNLITAQADGSGLQYRRNRYYDPATGRFTQQDPIGLAGGLNLYGFAGGDPITFTDPFGLCPVNQPDCPSPAEQLNSAVAAAFSAVVGRAVDLISRVGTALKEAIPGLARDVTVDAALAAAVPVVGELRAGRRVVAVAERVGRFLTEGRHLRELDAARKDFSRIGATTEEVVGAVARSSGWESVAEGGLAGGRVRVGTGVVQYTLKNLPSGETVLNAWIPGIR